jgi:hypothetical protein
VPVCGKPLQGLLSISSPRKIWQASQHAPAKASLGKPTIADHHHAVI